MQRDLDLTSQSRPPNQSPPDTVGRIESDSHADTTVAGSNMLCISYTDQTCDVYPFSDSYTPMKGVPIVTACTAHDNTLTGETTILIFNQVIWLGNKLENSLICPNQVRSFGIPLCDDPYDPNRRLGMQLENEEIPFDITNGMAGTTTRVPTWEEYHNFRHVVVTSDQPWDPRSDSLPHNRRISDAHIRPTRPTPVNHGEFESCMATCSPVYSPSGLTHMLDHLHIQDTSG